MGFKLYQNLACVFLLLAGCATAPSQLLPQEAPNKLSQPVEATLVFAGPNTGVEEAANMAMLAFREQVYLPFRSPSQAAIDSLSLPGRLATETIELTFRELGEPGLEVLESCAREFMQDKVGGIHLDGDDHWMLGVACTDMMGQSFGPAAAPTLVALSVEAPQTPSGVLARMAALRVLSEVVPQLSSDAAHSEEEEATRLAELKALGLAAQMNLRTRCAPELCTEVVMERWIAFAATYATRNRRHGDAEYRYLSTLRVFLQERANKWLPWLEEQTARRLNLAPPVTLPETRLLADLWARTASRTSASYFDERVVPVLAHALDPADVEGLRVGQTQAGTYVLGTTRSQHLVRILEEVSGHGLISPECGLLRPTPEELRSCISAQAHYWRREELARVQPDARAQPSD